MSLMVDVQIIGYSMITVRVEAAMKDWKVITRLT